MTSMAASGGYKYSCIHPSSVISFLPVPPSVPGLWVRAAAAVIFTAAAAYFDLFNRKWVPNYLVYAFAAVAVLANIVFYDPVVSLHAIAFGAAAFLLTYPLYRIGQLGGADVFAFASIAALVPYFQSPLLAPEQVVQYPFILSVLVPTSLFFILHMLVRFIPRMAGMLHQGKVHFTAAKVAGPVILAVSFAAFVLILSSLPVPLPTPYILIISFLFVSLLFFSLFKDEIKVSMVEMVPLRRLEEEDVVALELMDKKLVQRLRLPALIGAGEIALLKKSKVKVVPVYTGLPFFLPYLLLGLAATLLFGDLLLYLIPF